MITLPPQSTAAYNNRLLLPARVGVCQFMAPFLLLQPLPPNGYWFLSLGRSVCGLLHDHRCHVVTPEDNTADHCSTMISERNKWLWILTGFLFLGCFVKEQWNQSKNSKTACLSLTNTGSPSSVKAFSYSLGLGYNPLLLLVLLVQMRNVFTVNHC